MRVYLVRSDPAPAMLAPCAVGLQFRAPLANQFISVKQTHKHQSGRFQTIQRTRNVQKFAMAGIFGNLKSTLQVGLFRIRVGENNLVHLQ